MVYYIYHSENGKNTCDKCKSYDRKKFYDIKDVPKLPLHPNCRCTIETVHENNADKDKMCNCIDRLDNIRLELNNILLNLKKDSDEIENTKTDIEILKKDAENILLEFYVQKDIFEEEKNKHLSNCKNYTGNLCKEIETKLNDFIKLAKENTNSKNNIVAIEKNIKEQQQTLKNISDNIYNLKEKADKDFHTKQKCEINETVDKISNQIKSSREEQLIVKNELLKIKTKTKNIEKAMLSNKEYLKSFDERKELPCACMAKKPVVDMTRNILKKKNEGTNFAKTVTYRIPIGKNYNNFWYSVAKRIYGKDAAGMLDIAHAPKMNDKSYIKDTVFLKNLNDLAVKSDNIYLKEKVGGQFKDLKYDINKIHGYFFKTNSEPSKRIVKNKDFRKAILENKNNILKGNNFSFSYPSHDSNEENNLYYAFGKTDFRHPYIDKDNNLHIKMYDTYDFNKDDERPIVKAGRIEMELGNLKPFFTIHDIIVPKKELEKIWNQAKK